jgi:ribosomal protein S18 acetylase RimI-like enzyme
MECTIRTAEKKDVEDIIRLLKQIAQLHHTGRPDIFKSNANKYTHDFVHFKIKNPDECIFVAVDKADKVLGYVFCYFEIRKEHAVLKERKVLCIDDICIDDNKRGLGLGSLLLEKAIDYAKSTECVAIELNVWEFNEDAIKFYEKHNFSTKYRRMEMLLDNIENTKGKL